MTNTERRKIAEKAIDAQIAALIYKKALENDENGYDKDGYFYFKALSNGLYQALSVGLDDWIVEKVKDGTALIFNNIYNVQKAFTDTNVNECKKIVLSDMINYLK